MATSVLLADDHGIVRAGIKRMLEAEGDLEIVAEVGDGQEAVEAARRLQPDLAILDIQMPHVNGFEAIDRLADVAPNTRTIILSMYGGPEHLKSAIEAGAGGYVVKDAVPSELIAAVRAVVNGHGFINVEQAGNMIADGPKLSARETQVLKLLAYGHTNQEIAKTLDVSERTVATYRARVTDKLGLSSRADIVRYALDNGFLY